MTTLLDIALFVLAVAARAGVIVAVVSVGGAGVRMVVRMVMGGM